MFGNVSGRGKNNLFPTKCRVMKDSARNEDALTRFNTEMRKLRSSTNRSSDSLLFASNRSIRTILENQRRSKGQDVYGCRERERDSAQRHSIAYESLSREVSISSARASVMVYDDVNKKWVPSGSSSGLSKVQLYHHQVNNTFRVVGRKLQDHEIVINCAILRGLKYNQATGTFHQWRDNKQVYGLNFSSKDDADAFAKAMLQALDVLSNGSNISRSLGPTVAPTTQQQPVYQQQQHQQQQATAQFDEDMGYRTMTREDVAIIQERRMSQQNQATNGSNAISPSCPPTGPQQQQSGHHRTSSAPPAPAPPPQPQQMQPPMVSAVQQMPPVPPPQPPAAPPAPPCPPSGTMIAFSNNTNVPMAAPPTMNQYAQSPSQTSHPNQSQSQIVYATNQGNQYGVPAAQTNQYVGGGQNQMGQYSGSQSSLYGTSTGQVYGSQPSQGSQYASSQSSQYGSQYGSSNSINQYATVPNQYATVQSVQSGSSSNPYGTPTNIVNQYPGTHVNTYAPVGSSAGPPPPPMGPSLGPAAPPPPPPPPVPDANNQSANSGESNSNSGGEVNSLAAALQAARLKKKQQSQPVENSGSSTSSSGSGGGNYGTLGRGSGGSGGGVGMASMMDEMAKTLARRRAAVEKKQPEPAPEPESSPDKKSWDKNNSNNKFSNGAESPKATRKRFGSASEDTLLKVNGINDGSPFTSQEMEAFKVELIKEVRKEFQKIKQEIKQEIVEAVRTELSRR